MLYPVQTGNVNPYLKSVMYRGPFMVSKMSGKDKATISSTLLAHQVINNHKVSTLPVLLHVGAEGVMAPGRLYLEQWKHTSPSKMLA